MISWNTEDLHVPEIRQATGAVTHDDGHRYHVFGLSRYNRPPVRIEYANTQLRIDYKLDAVADFLTRSGIHTELRQHTEEQNLNIGIRLDVRENIRLAVAVVKTIVAVAEGALDLTSGDTLALEKKYPEIMDMMEEVRRTQICPSCGGVVCFDCSAERGICHACRWQG